MTQLVTGYLPSVILQIFLYTVAPIMMLFSTLEGPTSHSERKRSACCKVLIFTVWNIFFANVLSGTVISQLNVLSSPKDVPVQLAKAVPGQVNHIFFFGSCHRKNKTLIKIHKICCMWNIHSVFNFHLICFAFV